MNRG